MKAGLRFIVVAAFAAVVVSRAEEEAKSDEAAAEGEADVAKSVMEGLTINMASEVIDSRTFMIRDTHHASVKKYIRLGNVKPIEKGSMSDEEYQEREEAAKNALAQFVDKQMIFWKAGPDELQPEQAEDAEEETIVGDVWTIDGRHINGVLLKAGHVESVKEYESELARDILSAEADEKKRDSYKKLEEALREQNEAKKAAQEAEEEEEEDGEPVEGIGFGGWIGLLMLVALVVGAATNFGQGRKKRTNLNKKLTFWDKLKRN